MKTVHLYDPATGQYGGTYEAQESPLEPGVFLTPDASTDVAPPPILDGQWVRFDRGQWVVDTIPEPVPVILPVLSLAEQKALKTAEIDLAVNAAMSPILSVYSAAERDTWAIQEAEAVAWAANPAAATPMLTAIATQRGMPIADVVSNVFSKAAAFKSLAGATFGKRKAKIDLIDAATTAEELSAITW